VWVILLLLDDRPRYVTDQTVAMATFTG